MASTILDLDIDWKGLAVPFAYVLVLGSALFSFSTIYRKRKAGTLTSLMMKPPPPPSFSSSRRTTSANTRVYE